MCCPCSHRGGSRKTSKRLATILLLCTQLSFLLKLWEQYASPFLGGVGLPIPLSSPSSPSLPLLVSPSARLSFLLFLSPLFPASKENEGKCKEEGSTCKCRRVKVYSYYSRMLSRDNQRTTIEKLFREFVSVQRKHKACSFVIIY